MSKIWVQTIAPNNLHGFKTSQLGLQGLQDGLNLIFASNATGKSTLAKAMLSLFQPEGLELGATVNGTVFNGLELQSISKRRKDGSFPGFPGRIQDYYLDLPSLLQGLGKGSQVEQILGRGYEFPQTPKIPRSDRLNAVAKERLRVLKDARKLKLALVNDEQKLPELESRLRRAELANEMRRCLQDLLKRRGLIYEREEYLQRHRELSSRYPGLELQNVYREGEIRLKWKELEAKRGELASLNDRLSILGGQSPPLRPFLDSDRVRLENLEGRASISAIKLEELNRQVEAAGAKLTSLQATLFRMSGGKEDYSAFSINADLFDKLNSLATVADEEREKAVQTEAFARVLKQWEVDGTASLEELEAARRRLLAWFNRPSPSNASNWITLAVVAVAAVAFSLIPILWVRILGIALSAAACLFWAATQGNAKPGAATESDRSLEDLPSAFACIDPTPETVASKLDALAGVRARLEVARDLRLCSKPSDGLELTTKSVIEEVGISTDNPYRLSPLVDEIRRTLEAEDVLVSLVAERDALQRECSATRDQLREMFFSLGFASVEGREVEMVADFRSWLSIHGSCHQLGIAIAHLEAELNQFLDSQGIERNGEIGKRIDSFTDRMGPAAELAELQKSVEFFNVKIQEARLEVPNLLECLGLSDASQLDELDDSTINNEIRLQESLSEELESRRSEFEELRSRIRTAERETSLSLAEASYRQSLLNTEMRWTEASRESIRHRISEAVRERLMKEDLPPLLRGANEYLHQFSLGRYRLEFGRERDDQIGVLTVSDKFTGATQAFRELSSGTKVHTLLALKLSLINAQEDDANLGGFRFPLIADEPMAVSDPESSKAIAEAMIQVAAERQVIIFTSQESDVSLFKQLLPGLEVRGLHALPEFPVYAPPQISRTEIPPVGDRYDPRSPIGAQAVGVFFGQDHPEAKRRLDHSSVSEHRTKVIDGLEEVAHQLVITHPRLSPEEIQDQNWATTSFAPNLQEILEENLGCPHRFLTGLRAHQGKAYRKAYVEAAEAWLDENGFLIAPPSPEQVAALVQELVTGAEPLEQQQMIRSFAEAFIPGFVPESWTLVAPQTPKRKGETSVTLPPGGLFEDFLN
jgi:energy-coupling factor transporter ATP-binding protein EcfA2